MALPNDDLFNSDTDCDALAEVGSQLQQEFWAVQRSFALGFGVPVALCPEDWAELSHLQADLDSAMEVYGAWQTLAHELTSGFIPFGVGANAGKRVDEPESDYAPQTHGQGQRFGNLTSIPGLGVPDERDDIQAPFSVETLNFALQPGQKTPDTSVLGEQGQETHNLTGWANGHSPATEESGIAAVELSGNDTSTNGDRRPDQRPDARFTSNSSRQEAKKTTPGYGLPPLPIWPIDPGHGLQPAEKTNAKPPELQADEGNHRADGAGKPPITKIAKDEEIFGKEDTSFKPPTVAAVDWALPTVGKAISQQSPSQPAPATVKGLRDLAQWLEAEQPTPALNNPSFDRLPERRFLGSKAASSPGLAYTPEQNAPSDELLTVVQQQHDDPLVEHQSGANLTHQEPHGALPRLNPRLQADVLPAHGLSKMPNPAEPQAIKEISRQEDTSLKPATVAAVGWALPTHGETIFQQSPDSEGAYSSLEENPNGWGRSLQRAIAPQPPSNRQVPPDFPELVATTPAAPLPDLEDVLDAIAQEVSREYRQFYGD